MSTKPTSLSLTTIADGSQIIASTHRNNNSAVQTAVNSLISFFSGGLSSQVVTSGGGTTINYAYPPGYEYGYASKATDTSVTATTTGTANVVATTSSVTYDGATAVWIHIGAYYSAKGTTWIKGIVYMDGALLQDLVFYNTQGTVPSSGWLRYTPAAGAHTFGFASYVDAGTGTIAATGGAPAFIRVTKA